MGEFKRTVFFQENKTQGAKIVEFAGNGMPVMYTGIIDQHLATRTRDGLFDIFPMGLFRVWGRNAFRFLQHSSTNNVKI